MKFRIVENTIPLESGTHIIFIPQIERKETKTSGFFWWKKTIETFSWEVFYRDKTDKKLYSKKYESDNIFFKFIYLQSKEAAQKIIDEYQNKIKKNSLDYWAKNSMEWDYKDLVKIHECGGENIENLNTNANSETDK